MQTSAPAPLAIPSEPGSSPTLDPAALAHVERGAAFLRRVVRHLDRCSESTLDAYDAIELIAIVKSCWASEWDVWLDDLTDEQRAAAVAGEAPRFVEHPKRGLVPVPPASVLRFSRGLLDGEALHSWLAHRGEVFEELQGSEVVALGCPRPFEERHLCEIDLFLLEALTAEMKRLPPAASVLASEVTP